MDYTRLVGTLSGAGYLLLLLEVFFPAMGMAIFGALALIATIGVGFYFISIDLGAILLLTHTTAVSVGMVIVLTVFPKSPLGKKFLQHRPPYPPEEDDPHEPE